MKRIAATTLLTLRARLNATLIGMLIGTLIGTLTSGSALAKLPAPGDEAKAKAAETAAKTAHAGKVDAYKVCQAMDKVAGGYQASAKKAGKPASAPVATPPCADPGPYVAAGAASTPAASTPAASASTAVKTAVAKK